MNEAQSTNLPEKRNIETAALAPDEVFVLKRGVADRASVSEGTLCLVCPDGTFATVDVPKGDVARIARTLLGHPAVLLLAREGVALPKALPVPGNPLPIDTALPGTVAVANRLRRLAETLDMSTAASLELRDLADDLSRAPDPCAGYPSAEAVLRTCDAVIDEIRGNNDWSVKGACQYLRDRLAEVMAARPADTAPPRGGVAADVVDGWATTLLDLAYRPDARDRAVSLAETLRVAAAEARKAPAAPFDPAKHCDRAAVVAMLRSRGAEQRDRATKTLVMSDLLNDRADVYAVAANLVEQGADREVRP